MAVEKLFWQTDVEGATLSEIEGQALADWRAFMGDRPEAVAGGWVLDLDIRSSIVSHTGDGSLTTIRYAGTATIKLSQVNH